MRFFRDELFWIFLVFLLPLLIATSYFIFLDRGKILVKTESYGHLFPSGMKWQGSYTPGCWSFIHLSKPSSKRCALWEAQAPLLKKMLGAHADKFVQNLEQSYLFNNQKLDSWEYSLEQGALLVVDARGYLVLGYTYDQEPRKVFIELKKLIKSTS